MYSGNPQYNQYNQSNGPKPQSYSNPTAPPYPNQPVHQQYQQQSSPLSQYYGQSLPVAVLVTSQQIPVYNGATVHNNNGSTGQNAPVHQTYNSNSYNGPVAQTYSNTPYTSNSGKDPYQPPHTYSTTTSSSKGTSNSYNNTPQQSYTPQSSYIQPQSYSNIQQPHSGPVPQSYSNLSNNGPIPQSYNSGVSNNYTSQAVPLPAINNSSKSVGLSPIQQKLLQSQQPQSYSNPNDSQAQPKHQTYGNAIAGTAIGVGAASIGAAVAMTQMSGSSIVSSTATAINVIANNSSSMVGNSASAISVAADNFGSTMSGVGSVATHLVGADTLNILGKFGEIASQIPIFGAIGAASAVIATLAREAKYNQLAANLILTRVQQSNAVLIEMFQDVRNPSPNLLTLLETFKQILDKCQVILEKYQHRSYISRLLRGFSDNTEITMLDKSISDIINSIQLALQIKTIKLSQDTTNNIENMKVLLEQQRLKNDRSSKGGDPDGPVKADDLCNISKEDMKKLTEIYNIPMEELNDELRNMTSEIKASQDRIEADMALIKKALHIDDNSSKK